MVTLGDGGRLVFKDFNPAQGQDHDYEQLPTCS